MSTDSQQGRFFTLTDKESGDIIIEAMIPIEVPDLRDHIEFIRASMNRGHERTVRVLAVNASTGERQPLDDIDFSA